MSTGRKPLPRKVPRTAPATGKKAFMAKEDLNQMTTSFSHLAEIGKGASCRFVAGMCLLIR